MTSQERDLLLILVPAVGIPLTLMLARLGDRWARNQREKGKSGWLIDKEYRTTYYDSIRAREAAEEGDAEDG